MNEIKQGVLKRNGGDASHPGKQKSGALDG
jgi:hypothetical protein